MKKYKRLVKTIERLTEEVSALRQDRKDHTTVIHGVARIANEATIYPKVRADLAALAFAMAG